MQESRRGNVGDRKFDHVGLIKARVDLPEKGTTPESGGGTATQSRAVVTAATLAPLADSQPPRRLCKREPGLQAVPPQSLERVRKAIPGEPPAMTGGVLIAVWLRWTRAKRRRAEEQLLFDPPPDARLLGTALANDQKQKLRRAFLEIDPADAHQRGLLLRVKWRGDRGRSPNDEIRNPKE